METPNPMSTLANVQHYDFLRRCILQQNALCTWMFVIVNVVVIVLGARLARFAGGFAFMSLLLSTWLSQLALERSITDRCETVAWKLLIRASFVAMLLASVVTGIALVSFCWTYGP